MLEYVPQKAEQICGWFDINKKELVVVGEDRIPDIVLERLALMYLSQGY